MVTLEPGARPSRSCPAAPSRTGIRRAAHLTVPESKLARATGVVLHPDFEPGFVPGAGNAHRWAATTSPSCSSRRRTFGGVKPVASRAPRTLDRLRPALRVTAPFTLVGYGMEIRDGLFYAPGYRKTARTRFEDLIATGSCSTNTAAASRASERCALATPARRSSSAGSNVQVSLLHDVPGTCFGTSHSQRLDTGGRFLAPYLPKH